MKRGIGAAIIGLVFALFISVQSVAAADLNSFRISNYDIQYELSRDSEGRSVLKTTERITAHFPSYDQNHGLERAIPTTYDGHSTSLKILEAKNTNGDTEHSVNESDGITTLRIGDADSYVHGVQTYRIVYTQRDVTKSYADTARDEWYWDTNGVEWQVPIEKLSVSVTLSDELTKKLEQTPFCYFGNNAEAANCSTNISKTSNYTFGAQGLSPGQNITVAFGFNKDTFAGYSMSLWEKLLTVWTVMQFIAFPLAVTMVVIAGVMYARKTSRSKELHTIVAEYIPPKDTSVIMSAQVVGGTKGPVFSAQLIDLAVRRYIAIVETKQKSFWKAAEYDIVITGDLTQLRVEEQEIIKDMFGHLPLKDERKSLKELKTDTGYTSRTLDNDKKVTELSETVYALRHTSAQDSRIFYRWATGLLIIGIILLSIPFCVASAIIALLGLALRPLTDKGLELRRYLLGLDRYIKASEKERLAFLQGPETAGKVGYAVDTENSGQLLKLYERVLPYAILFGHEKEWASRLGEFYGTTGTSPDWYSGTTAFNAAVFASSLSSFSQASMYSAGASSSSGGSSGGGSSGGGGGGGGGGGW